MSWFLPRSSFQGICIGTCIPRTYVNIPMPAGVKTPHESWETLADRIQRAASVLGTAPDLIGDDASKRQAADVARANRIAWAILMEGKMPESQRHDAASENEEAF